MSESTLVSIVIPTYNRAHYLDQCIAAALSQTYPCEVVVCDHGSTDHTPQIAEKYADRITYVRKEKDFGVHFTWLDGVINTNGAFIHINYDDDWIEPDFIERCMKLFSEDVGFVFSDVRLFTENGSVYSEPKFKPFFKETGIYRNFKLYYFGLNNLISPGCAIFRRNILMDNLFVGRIPFATQEYKGVGPDLLFSLMSTVKYKKFGFVSEPLAVFRSHDNSITVDATKDKVKRKKIADAYNDARAYFLISKFIKLFGIKAVFLFFLKTTMFFLSVIKKSKNESE